MTEPWFPKAFVSHAWEDKERFVMPFVTALREAGVDTWIDAWEISPGDSIVKKIFDEGLGKADAAIIVLSRTSVQKPWVKEELDSAFVAKIQGRIRVIPVVIEDCDIPRPLEHLLHVRIRDLHDIRGAVEEITKTLYGLSSKPPLGSPPRYITEQPVVRIRGLESTDVHVLLALGRMLLNDVHGPVGSDELAKALAELNISSKSIGESLEVLEAEGYVRGHHALGKKFYLAELSSRGRNAAFEALVPEYDSSASRVALQLLNQNSEESTQIATSLNLPGAVVEHILEYFSSQGLITTRRAADRIFVFEVSARLRRAFQT